jgi:hypothetical protein
MGSGSELRGLHLAVGVNRDSKLLQNRDFTHPMKEDVKKKFFSVPLEGTRGW